MILGIVFLLALFLRVWSAAGAPLHPDEIHYAYDVVAAEETGSWSAIRDLTCAMQVERRIGHPMVAQLVGRWFWFAPLGGFFDWTPLFLRMPNILLGAMLVPIVWCTLRRLRGPAEAWVGALLVAVQPGLSWYSGSMYLDSVYTFFIALMLLCAAWGSRRGGFLPPLLMGVFMGIVAGTKISAPFLGPSFLVLLLVAPAGTTLRERLYRFGTGFMAAVVMTLLLADPMSYINQIRQPSDPRYLYYWNDDTGILNLVMSYLDSYYPTLMWDAPLTTFLLAGVAIYAAIKARHKFPLFLVFMILWLLPLSLLHNPQLSGAHGYLPIHYLMVLLIASFPWRLTQRVQLAALGTQIVICVTIIGAQRHEVIPDWAGSFRHPMGRSAVYTAVKEKLHHRSETPWQILVIPLDPMAGELISICRHTQLSEGAIILLPSNRVPMETDAYEWADELLIPIVEGVPEVPTEFTLVSEFLLPSRLLYRSYKRTSGITRRSVEWQDMIPIPISENEVRYALPGAVYPASGWMTMDGAVLDVWSNTEDKPWLDGRRNFIDWGSGLVVATNPPPDDAKVGLAPPKLADIFWDF